VEPNVFIGRKEPGELWSDHANEVSQHRDEDKAAIKGEDEACASRSPNGELEGVKASQLDIGRLRIPSIGEDGEVKTVPDDIER
jgi:hypothetical protein